MLDPKDCGQAIWPELMAKEVDRLSIETYKVPSLDLMERAGYWVAVACSARCKAGTPITILAGPGNNGGDALVAARYLKSWFYNVLIVDCSLEGQKTSSDRQTQLERVQSDSVPMIPMKLCTNEQLKNSLILDGIFGIGLKGELRPGPQKEFLHRIASLPSTYVIAIDIPSGVLCDVWDQAPPPLEAQHTITFGSPKAVHILYPSARYCGEVHVRKIGFHQQAIENNWDQNPTKMFSIKQLPATPWSSLKEDAHKFQRGHVLVMGGSPGKSGAPIMSALAAANGGAGWVTFAKLYESAETETTPPHIVEECLLEGNSLSAKKLQDFVNSRKVGAIVVGPGTLATPLSPSIAEALSQISHSGISVILDAGACHNISDTIKNCPFNPQTTLITPHPGEFSRGNLGPHSLIKIDDLLPLREKLDSLGISLFYKSASPIFVSPTLDSFPCKRIGNPKLGKAGSGDVLAGLCAVLTLSKIPFWTVPFVAMDVQARAIKRLVHQGITEPTPLDIAQSIGYD